MTPKKAKLISHAGSWLIRLLALTLRVRFTDNAGFYKGPLPSPAAFAFWHNRIFALVLVHYKYYRRNHASVLTSASRDGTLLAEFMARFGMGAVRGSSSRRGAAAVRELNDLLQKKEDIGISPDGPRGPLYKLGPGLIYLAQKNNLPVVVVHAEYSRCVRLKSWDKFMIPLPFSRVDITMDAPRYIPQTATDEAFEAERAKLEKIMQPVTL